MNKKNIFLLIASFFLVFSCADEDLAPIIDYNNLQFGAYIRLVEIDNEEFDLQAGDPSTTYSVEFVDIEDGGTVTEYRVFVSFEDNSPTNGDSSTGEQLFGTFDGGDFSVNGDGYVGTTVSFTLSDLTSLLGLTKDDLFARDDFEFRTEISTTEGRTHTAANSSATVNGDAFQGFFNFSIPVICSVPDSDFAGGYLITYEEEPTGGRGPAFGTTPGIVNLEVVSKTERKFTVTYLPEDASSSKDITIEFELLCEITEASTVSTGLSCVTGSTSNMVQADEPGEFDIDDDSSFTLNLVEFDKDGGCGLAKAPLKIKLVKQ